MQEKNEFHDIQEFFTLNFLIYKEDRYFLRNLEAQISVQLCRNFGKDWNFKESPFVANWSLQIRQRLYKRIYANLLWI